ncbi:MAG TPA: hypothetical protein PKA20_22575 [Burkholderiaceae bacterium]|nr:hypothetical protein [Burkholderiaceae bacterium]
MSAIDAHITSIARRARRHDDRCDARDERSRIIVRRVKHAASNDDRRRVDAGIATAFDAHRRSADRRSRRLRMPQASRRTAVRASMLSDARCAPAARR